MMMMMIGEKDGKSMGGLGKSCGDVYISESGVSRYRYY